MAEPLVWLPLDGSLRNLGLYDAVVTNHAATVSAEGKIGQCYVTNGSAGYITAAVPDLSTSAWSLCAWVYPTASSADGHQYVVGMNETTASFTGVLCLYQDKYSVRTKSSTYGAGAVTLNKWAHMAATYDLSTLKLYVNGELVLTQTAPAAPVSATTCYIGMRGGSAGGFAGRVNDVRIYDSCLSDKEVHDIAQGLILHYPLNDQMIEPTTNMCTIAIPGGGNQTWGGHTTVWTGVSCADEPVPFDMCLRGAITYSTETGSGGGASRSVQSFVVSPSTTYTYSIYVKSTDDIEYISANFLYRYEYPAQGQTKLLEAGIATKSRMIPIGNGWYRFWGTFTTNSGTNYLQMSFYTYPSKDVTYWIGGWQFEQKDHLTPFVMGSRSESVVYDCSGYGHDGIATNITLSSDAPRYNSSSVFSSSYIKVNDNLWMANAASEFTINLWAYMDDWTTWASRLFSCTESGGFNTEPGNSGYMRFPNHVYTNAELTSSTYMYDSNGLKLSDLSSGWHMLTFVKTLAGSKIYLDGSLCNNYAYANYGEHFNTGVALYLGCESSSAPTSPYFAGKQSDFRFYYTELSVSDIAELYNVGASVDNMEKTHAYEFVENGNGNILTDADVEQCNNNYGAATYIPIYAPVEGDKYIVTLCVTPAEGVARYDIYLSQGYRNLGSFAVSGTDMQIISREVTISYYSGRTPTDNFAYACPTFYRFPNDGTVTTNSTVHWVRMTKTSTATPPSVEKTGVFNCDSTIDGAEYSASIFKSGDISAVDLIEI